MQTVTSSFYNLPADCIQQIVSLCPLAAGEALASTAQAFRDQIRPLLSTHKDALTQCTKWYFRTPEKEVGKRVFSSLQLKSFSLSHPARISKETFQKIEMPLLLEKLDLTNTEITTEGMEHIFSQCKQLKQLEIRCFGVNKFSRELPEGTIKKINLPSSLEVLHIDYRFFLKNSRYDLASECPELHTLHIYAGNMKGSLSQITFGAKLHSLTAEMAVSDDDLEHVFTECPRLEKLSVRANSLKLSGLIPPVTITSLCLPSLFLSRVEGFFSFLSHLSELRELSLVGCVIPEGGEQKWPCKITKANFAASSFPKDKLQQFIRDNRLLTSLNWQRNDAAVLDEVDLPALMKKLALTLSTPNQKF